MKKILIIILIVLTPTLVNAQWEQLGDKQIGENDGDTFGSRVSMSKDGLTIAASADFHNNASGQVRVFTFKNNQWEQVGQSIVGDTTNGNSILKFEFSSNGKFLVTGAPYNSEMKENAGLVTVYRLESNKWVQMGQKIYGDSEFEQIGFFVSLSSDGLSLVVGGIGNKDVMGNIRVYKYVNENWEQIGKEIIGDGYNTGFGYYVDFTSDGNSIAIGKYENLSDYPRIGKIDVYRFVNGEWTKMGETIIGEDDINIQLESIKLYSEGNSITCYSVINEEDKTKTDRIITYKYIDNNWILTGNSLLESIEPHHLPLNVSFNSDCSVMAIGDPHNDSLHSNSGLTRIYNLVGTEWVQKGQVLLGEAFNDWFGTSTSFNSDGDMIVISGVQHNVSGSGYVKVFRYNPETSVYERAEEESISVYPNPTKGEVNIQFTERILPSEISIVDTTGKQVYSIELTDNNTNIDISDLAAGIYYFHIKNSNGTKIKKIIKE